MEFLKDYTLGRDAMKKLKKSLQLRDVLNEFLSFIAFCLSAIIMQW